MPMRSFAVSLAALALVAASPARGNAQDERPDLSGTWSLQRPDSMPSGRGAAPRGGDGSPSGGPESPGGRRGAGPPRGPAESAPARPARTLVIAQTDSTVTIAGERLPSHTYFTDGREERQSFAGVERVVKAYWDWDDLVVERRSVQRENEEKEDEDDEEEDERGARAMVQTYRFDEKGPRLIVITEVEQGEDRGSLRIHRIYTRADPAPLNP